MEEVVARKEMIMKWNRESWISFSRHGGWEGGFLALFAKNAIAPTYVLNMDVLQKSGIMHSESNVTIWYK